MESNERVVLSVDGNCGCALLGGNIQEGDAEFVEILYPDPSCTWSGEAKKAERTACFQALHKLRQRLDRPDLPYAWSTRSPGAAGA
jgi:hypothetical protein